MNDGFAKLNWATKHIPNLNEAWGKFARDGYPVVSEDDKKTGYRTFKIGPVAPIPEEIPLLIGDIVHNVRSSLDHLIYRLVFKSTKGRGPFNNLYFPTAENLADFECRLKRASEAKTASHGVVQRLRPEIIEAIRCIEPYGGGKGEFIWLIHKLDVIDKHHLLFTVAASVARQTMSVARIDEIRRAMSSTFKRFPDINGITEANIFLEILPNLHFPLESGYVLGTFPKAEIHQDMQFPVEVAFGEPEILKGKLVVMTLHHMAQTVTDIFFEFARAKLIV